MISHALPTLNQEIYTWFEGSEFEGPGNSMNGNTGFINGMSIRREKGRETELTSDYLYPSVLQKIKPQGRIVSDRINKLTTDTSTDN